MTKIPNDGNKPEKINGKDINFRGQNSDNHQVGKPGKEINDLGNNPGDYIGRSQVNKYQPLTFNGEVIDPKQIEAMRKLLSPMRKNPELYFTSDRAYDRAYTLAKRNGDPHPERLAAEAQAAFIKEFGKQEI